MGKLVKTRLARLMMSAALLDLFWSGVYFLFGKYVDDRWGFPYPAAFKEIGEAGLGYLTFHHARERELIIGIHR
jgi:hypothetical protein